MTINLTKTQFNALLKALDELETSESVCGCNDLFRNDKFYKLSPSERKEAKKLSDDYGWNFTATHYLRNVLKNQI